MAILRDGGASKLKKIGAKKGSEASQAGYEADNPHRRALLSYESPILTNFGPHLGPRLRKPNAPGGMRGAPGDSRFELKLSLHSSYTVAPEGVAGFNRSAHPAGPGLEA